jgi:hypothetical protein
MIFSLLPYSMVLSYILEDKKAIGFFRKVQGSFRTGLWFLVAGCWSLVGFSWILVSGRRSNARICLFFSHRQETSDQ